MDSLSSIKGNSHKRHGMVDNNGRTIRTVPTFYILICTDENKAELFLAHPYNVAVDASFLLSSARCSLIRCSRAVYFGQNYVKKYCKCPWPFE